MFDSCTLWMDSRIRIMPSNDGIELLKYNQVSLLFMNWMLKMMLDHI